MKEKKEKKKRKKKRKRPTYLWSQISRPCRGWDPRILPFPWGTGSRDYRSARNSTCPATSRTSGRRNQRTPVNSTCLVFRSEFWRSSTNSWTTSQSLWVWVYLQIPCFRNCFENLSKTRKKKAFKLGFFECD